MNNLDKQNIKILHEINRHNNTVDLLCDIVERNEELGDDNLEINFHMIKVCDYLNKRVHILLKKYNELSQLIIDNDYKEI